jgi:hypothetical protein
VIICRTGGGDAGRGELGAGVEEPEPSEQPRAVELEPEVRALAGEQEEPSEEEGTAGLEPGEGARGVLGGAAERWVDEPRASAELDAKGARSP